MSRKNKHLQKAAAQSQSAADKGAAAIDHAAAALNQALAALGDYVTAAQEKAGPAAKNAIGKTIEAAESAREKVEPKLTEAVSAVQPKLSGAYAAVSPGIDQARHKVQDDLLPKLTELLHEAEQHPAVAEAQKRGNAAIKSLKGELVVPEPAPVAKKKSRAKSFAKIVAAGALLAGAAVAVRQFLLSKDDGWTAHEPSPAYTPPTRPEDEVVFTTSTPEAAAADAEAVTEEVPVTDEHGHHVKHDPDVTTEGDPISDMEEEGGLVAGADEHDNGTRDEQAATAASPYGEGAYVGTEPPEGYIIKGNERSKKYHVPESGGYERTIADVWFNSEDAAQAAGFSKAQR
ncbi:hypothetical protein ACPCG0_11090 [Propionibacteriaceae bacterium Y1923]|uniref:sunset domain-containing protein n=1 Tax=Aestuariimicrobium sp. Y1814 TaxID=3418742 RepID=UPI003C25C93D